tara:strand:+ start:2046 stop:3215 length:1170 start_codon:yes stop_codon:yes gene_type:complete
MLTKNINFSNFLNVKRNIKIKSIVDNLKKNFSEKKDELLLSLSQNYKYSFKLNQINKYKKFQFFNIVGMGGSTLGTQAIYSFLKFKIKKKFFFLNNLSLKKMVNKKDKKLNIFVSKSGNTLETISNLHSLDKIKHSIFITENKNSYLRSIAEKMKSEIFDHNNFIGGRYSVLSETGMLPASLMGLDPKKFKRLNYLIKNKTFIDKLILNVSGILSLYKKKKTNSIILNYDETSQDLFNWYQQLVAESLGKKNQGILPIISLVPKDNHSLMQLYLDGNKNNFFTFFFVEDQKTNQISKNKLLKSHNYLKNKKTGDILSSQFYATQSVFKRRNIPFRSFVIKKRTEETLGEIFTFFILETIILGRALKINPFDQPEIELIKKETNRILSKY